MSAWNRQMLDSSLPLRSLNAKGILTVLHGKKSRYAL